MEPRIVISSLVQPYEDAEKIVESINVFFPDWNSEDLPKKGTFPNKNKAVIISGFSKNSDLFFKQLRIQRILDTEKLCVEAHWPCWS